MARRAISVKGSAADRTVRRTQEGSEGERVSNKEKGRRGAAKEGKLVGSMEHPKLRLAARRTSNDEEGANWPGERQVANKVQIGQQGTAKR